MDLIEELRWRGMFHDMMPGTDEHLRHNAPITGYIGFDPTAASLHIGNLATIMLLVHLQRAGHRPVALVGGATGMIGDPSGKSAERNLLDEETLRRNQNGIKAQLEKFLDFSEGPTGAMVVNNYDWFKEFGFLQFLREVGKHLTVNYMMAKDSVKRRIGGNDASADSGGAEGISYTEFSYQLLQGYDYVHLHRTLGCTLQMGASDQWGNITTGTELIRRMSAHGGEGEAGSGQGKAYALTGQLITKSDGTKYGKSETGTVWLDATMTSPYQFYQFFLNAADADAPRLIRVFTLLTEAEITALEAEHAQAPHKRILQKALAQDVTTRVHSAEAYEAALSASEVLFGGGDLASLDEATLLDVFAGVPRLEVPREQATGLSVLDLLSEATGFQIFPSKGEARKMMQAGGVSLNRQRADAPAQPVAELPLVQERYVVAQKGKKNYFLIKLT
ncbi:tyrosine--tRNA ligase [Hymenobacter busanensis]|uniref:Tyrosine--tRNA ligase n=1 Tax=Hymenobacter busanensis TaxID=2607656 RepID=A0A7L4ZYA8_9BACT|nr:tyrosine--tRNA ligase [Hymenobacter busanensis]KAA9339827.1 tyrosine--tRNA ligase [Hymenobacter busanensis]QHJ06420.1 tyrosine--tRNA ligase [Hymenobacter busanensis]